MAIDEASICNDALSYVGVKHRIQTLLDDNPDAEACNQHYEKTRDELLARRRWSFAERQSALTELGSYEMEDDDPYTFLYLAPPDMLEPHGFLNSQAVETPDRRPEYAMRAHPTSASLPVIATNVMDPVLVYTYKVTQPGLFPVLFAGALSWWLAVKLAASLAEDVTKYGAIAYQNAVLAESQAWAADLNNRQRVKQAIPTYIRARWR